MSKQSHNFKVGDRVVVDNLVGAGGNFFMIGDAGRIVSLFGDNGSSSRVQFDLNREGDGNWLVATENLKPESTTTPITEKEFKIRFFPTPASDFHGLERNRENLIKATSLGMDKWHGLGCDGATDFKHLYNRSGTCHLCSIQGATPSKAPDCSTCPVVLSGHVECGAPNSAWRRSFDRGCSTQPMQDALRKSLHWLMDESNSLEPVKSKVVDVWPVKGDSYFIVDEDGSATECVYLDHESDVLRAEVGNFYRTREEAKLVAKRRKLIVKYEALCKRLWDELGMVIDWSDSRQAKRCYEVTATGRKMNNALCTTQTLPSSRYLPGDDNAGMDSNRRVREDFSYDELYLIHTGEER